jgi:hypothetical protein
MWGRKEVVPKPSAAQSLSRFVQRAAVEFEEEMEELETIQITLRGLIAFTADCEGRARERGSTAAEAFRLVSQATQAISAGTDRVIAALPPPSLQSLNAVRSMLGIEETEDEQTPNSSK